MNTIELIQGFETERLFDKICHEKPEMIAQILVCMKHPKAAVKERVYLIKKIMDEMGSVKKEDVKETQWKITKHIRNLFKQGRIKQ